MDTANQPQPAAAAGHCYQISELSLSGGYLHVEPCEHDQGIGVIFWLTEHVIKQLTDGKYIALDGPRQVSILLSYRDFIDMGDNSHYADGSAKNIAPMPTPTPPAATGSQHTAGRYAYCLGKSRHSNPNQRGTVAWYQWNDGWKDEQQALAQVANDAAAAN